MFDTPAAELFIDALDPADGPIERVDTHISTLVFQNGWAYKIKRPVHYEFIDLSTREKRRRICEREVELNRRFAPDVYDSVVPIRNPGGDEVDCAVRMHRMPIDRRLSTLVDRDDPGVRDHVRAVARTMAATHACADRGVAINHVATREALERLWVRSLDDMQAFAGSFLDGDTLVSVRNRAMRYLDGRGDLLNERIARGHIVDGHGDLLSNDIFCLDDGPRILDCLEFDDELRFGDVLADIAFLVMDFERLGHRDLGDRFVADYVEFSDEHHPLSLLHHYVAYRALVRSKVACLRGVGGDRAAASEAQQLLELASDRLKQSEITLVIVGGLPGSGKSTVAEGMSQATGWPVLSSDVVRKELAGLGGEPRPASFGHGIYSADMTATTYSTLLERADVALRHGQSIIIDASFIAQVSRADAADVARRSISRFVALCCEAPTDVRVQRIRERPHDQANPSDATPEVSARMAEQSDRWSDATVIDTSSTFEKAIAVALDAVS
jgi:uncharacterized protein